MTSTDYRQVWKSLGLGLEWGDICPLIRAAVAFNLEQICLRFQALPEVMPK